MSDLLEFAVIDLPGLRSAPDIESLESQAGVAITRRLSPTLSRGCPLLIVPDTATWRVALAWMKTSGWSTAIRSRREGLVLGLGIGTTLLGRTITGGGLTVAGLNALDITSCITDARPGRRAGTLMGVEFIATSTAAEITCGPEATGWVHLDDPQGRCDEGALRFSDATIMGTSLTGLFSIPALRDVFCTEVGRRAGLTYVA